MPWATIPRPCVPRSASAPRRTWWCPRRTAPARRRKWPSGSSYTHMLEPLRSWPPRPSPRDGLFFLLKTPAFIGAWQDLNCMLSYSITWSFDEYEPCRLYSHLQFWRTSCATAIPRRPSPIWAASTPPIPACWPRPPDLSAPAGLQLKHCCDKQRWSPCRHQQPTAAFAAVNPGDYPWNTRLGSIPRLSRGEIAPPLKSYGKVSEQKRLQDPIAPTIWWPGLFFLHNNQKIQRCIPL